MRTVSIASLKLLFSLAAVVASVPAHAVVCGDTLYGPVTLTADVVCGAGHDGLFIGAHRVRIELNGFSIIGPYTFAAPTAPATGVISFGFERVQIVGPGSITGFERPVDIDGGYNHLISDVEIVAESGLPVSVRNASGAVIERSRITAIEIASDKGTRATANRIIRNDVGQRDPALPGGGIFLRGCGTADNMVASNYVDPGHAGVGAFGARHAINLVDGAHSNQVLKNRILAGDVLIAGSSNNMVAGNDLDNQGAPYGQVGLNIQASWQPVACAGGDFISSNKNIVRDNRVRGGDIGLLIDGYGVAHPTNPNAILITAWSSANLVNKNTFEDIGFLALLFGSGAGNNDALYNNYINVFQLAQDHGVGNLWP